MPQTPPPAQPVQQFQFQDQQQNTPVYINDESNNETNSRSKSENVNNLSGSLSNIQVNNNIDSYFQYERGIRVPATTLTLSGYASSYDHGAVVSLNIPLGKRNRKLAYQQVQTKIVDDQIRTCLRISETGYEINNHEALNLEHCKYLSKRQQIKQTKNAVQSYQDQIRKQQVVIDKLLKRLDRMETERNNPFKSRG